MLKCDCIQYAYCTPHTIHRTPHYTESIDLYACAKNDIIHRKFVFGTFFSLHNFRFINIKIRLSAHSHIQFHFVKSDAEKRIKWFGKANDIGAQTSYRNFVYTSLPTSFSSYFVFCLRFLFLFLIFISSLKPFLFQRFYS